MITHPECLVCGPTEDGQVVPLKLVVENKLVGDDADFVTQLASAYGEWVDMQTMRRWFPAKQT